MARCSRRRFSWLEGSEEDSAEDLEVCHPEAAGTALVEADTSVDVRAIAGTAEAIASRHSAIHDCLLRETFHRQSTSTVVGRAQDRICPALTTCENPTPARCAR